jgi:tripartite-type tricarboxylate transporter receptor subunit TctC
VRAIISLLDLTSFVMTPYPESPFSLKAARTACTPNGPRRKTLNIFLASLLGGSVLAAVAPVGAADNYPSKPIRIVCPFPPGGGADSVARILGDKLSERSGKPVIVDNRSGASGAIGTGIVAKAAPDGYTVLLGSSSILAASPALHGQTYQAIASELSPVLLISRISYVLVIHPSIPSKSVAEFIRYAGTQPGRINYASSGIGTASHLAMELFKNMARVDLTHVPFKGSSPAVIALIGGQVQAGFNNMVPALPHIKSGRLRALGVSGPERWAGLPELPTIAASGLPGYEAVQWYGVLLPVGTPRAIVNHLHQELSAILKLADVREHLMSEGGDVVGSTPKEFAVYMEREIEKWTKVVKTANIRAD